MSTPMFIFGGDTGVKSPEQLKKLRAVAEALSLRNNGVPKNVGEGLASIGEAIRYRRLMNRIEAGDAEGQQKNDEAFSPVAAALGLGGGSASSGSSKVASALFGKPDAAGEVAASAPAPDVSSNGSTFEPFIETVKAGGLTNPYGLAAVASTGKAESGWSPENAARTWSDPSESGKPGTAGGIMSWRGPRYQALAATGDLSPEGQAKFFLQEDPNLITSLNGAKSVEEAQNLMNRAWAFKGYDRPGGEAARRMQTASAYLPQFQGGEGPNEVASLDPRAGMAQPQTAAQAIEAQAPTQGGGLADEVAEFRKTPEYAAQFPGRNAVAAALEAKGVGAGQPTVQPSPAVQQVAGAMSAQQAQGGGQQQPAPQQVAQAQPMAQPQQSGPTMQQLYTALQSPWLDDNRRALVISEIQRQQQMQQSAQQEQTWRARQAYEAEQQRADPAYQQNIQLRQAQIEALQNKPQKEWQRLDDNTLYSPSTGETKSVPVDPNRPSSDLGLNPQYGTDAAGNPVLLQLGKDGRTVQSQMPAGVTLSKEPIKLDAGTHFVLLDPITRQPVGQIPKNLSGEAEQTAEGKARAEAKANLGQLEDSGGQVLSTIDSLANDPYLDSMVGSVQGRMPNFTSDAARVQGKMDQIGGQQFLQAFNSLKGGGQITEIEGKKATDAIAALNTAQNETDYRNALSTFRGIVETGLARARQKAGGGNPTTQMDPSFGPPASPGAPSAPSAAGDPLSAARAAIARGAPRDAVIQRLRQSGINPEGL